MHANHTLYRAAIPPALKVRYNFGTSIGSMGCVHYIIHSKFVIKIISIRFFFFISSVQDEELSGFTQVQERI